MLIDSFKRTHEYLRVSVTDRCNLRCVYCMPEEGFDCLYHEDILRNEEFIELISLFVNMGIKKIRFTGGEPLVRKGFIDILERTKEIAPNVELAVTTNGVALNNYIDDLYRLGVKKINVSLDTLSKERFLRLTRRDYLSSVLENIDKVLEYNYFEVKLNAVLFDETLVELDDFISYCLKRNLTLRFIERMPFCEQEADNSFISSDILLTEFAKRGKLIRTEENDSAVACSYDVVLPTGTVHIGIIPPISHKFCSVCNRLRLTADGLLKTCLLSSDEYNIKDCLRAGADENVLRTIIQKALGEKGAGHNLNPEHKNETVQSGRKMSSIGG